MANKLKLLLLSLFILLLNSCTSTVMTVGCMLDGTIPRPFEGIQTWWEIINHYDSGAIVGFYLIPDVPFSFTMDVIFLPLTCLLPIFASVITTFDKMF